MEMSKFFLAKTSSIYIYGLFRVIRKITLNLKEVAISDFILIDDL